jgi:hypothetical protein
MILDSSVAAAVYNGSTPELSFHPADGYDDPPEETASMDISRGQQLQFNDSALR